MFLRRTFLALFLAGFAVRLLLVTALQSYRITENTEVVLIARSFAATGELANPFGQGGLTAHAAPVYPLILGTIFRIFGTGALGNFVQEAFASAITALLFASFPALAVRIGLNRGVGWTAGWIGALVPLQFWNQTKGSSETSLLALAVLWCIAWHASAIRQGRLGIRDLSRLGLAWGFAALISPIVLAPFAGFLAFMLVCQPGRRIALPVLTASLVVLTCLTPWAVRNRLALGHWIWTRSNLGLELHISNNATAAPDFDTNTLTPVGRQHPHVNPVEAFRVRRFGEYEYNQAMLATAIGWIRSNPAAFASLTLKRVELFWLRLRQRPLQAALVYVQALYGLAGLALLTFRRQAAAVPFWILFATYPPVYYVVQASGRYRYPVDPFLLLLATYLVQEALARIRSAVGSETEGLESPGSLPAFASILSRAVPRGSDTSGTASRER